MTGDAALQISILIIGFIVFAIAMMGGILTMKEWALRSERSASSTWGAETTSGREARQVQPINRADHAA
jgi:hypothetical protein